MATLVSSTTCNSPDVSDPEGLADVLEEWGFVPSHGSMTAKVDNGRLHIYGECGFEPYRQDGYRKTNEQRDHVDQEGFGEAIAPFLNEPLIVHQVSKEKLRYPFGQMVFYVDPDTEQAFMMTGGDMVNHIEEELIG